MKVVTQITEWRQIRNTLTQQIGFVPTMGHLHDGHLTLIEKSIEENALTVVSLFVNPTQFNDSSDYDNYPLSIREDILKLETVGVDYCFMPEKKAMYPDDYTYQIRETEKSLCLEGKHRPGHFDGVLTVVLKLLMLIQPAVAYFGEKDYQQYELIKNMAQAFLMDINVIACPTVREPSGLAFSSRNARLDPTQRKKANQFAKHFHQGHDVDTIKQRLEEENIQIDYIEEVGQRRYGAVWIDDIRLIDNYEIKDV